MLAIGAGMVVFGVLGVVGGFGLIRLRKWGYDIVNLLLIYLMCVGVVIMMALFFTIMDIVYGDWKWTIAILLHPATYISVISFYISKYMTRFQVQMAFGKHYMISLKERLLLVLKKRLMFWRKREDLSSKYEGALEEYRREGDKIKYIERLSEIGENYLGLREYSEAIKYYQEANLIMEEEEGQEYMKLLVKIKMGQIYRLIGENSDAIKVYEEALKLAEKNEVMDSRVIILRDLGKIYESYGKFYDAFEYYNEALKVAEETNNLDLIENLLGNIGEIYLKWGKQEKTLELLRRQLEICVRLGKRKEADKLNGIIFEIQNKYEQTVRILKFLYYQGIKEKDIMELAKILIELGKSYLKMGKLDLAGIFFVQAYNIFRGYNVRYNMGLTLNYLGDVALAKLEYRGVIKYSEQAVEIFDEYQDLANLGHAYRNIAAVYKERKEYEYSYENYYSAIEILENLIGSTRSEEIRKSYRSEQMKPYQEIIELLLDWYRADHDDEHLQDALKYLELTKAREILDKLEKEKVEIYSCPEFRYLVKKEQELVKRIVKLEDEIDNEKIRGGIGKTVQKKLTEMKEELKELRVTLMEKCNDPGLVRVPEEYNPIPDVQNIFKRDKFIIWEFIYLSELSHFKNSFYILAWDGEEIKIFQSNRFNKQEILELLKEFHKSLSYVILEKLQDKLRKLIPEELFNTLEGKSKLVLIPHDILHLFPWEIVPELGLKIPIVRSYSLGLLYSCIKREKEMTDILLITNPNSNIPSMNLKGADLEVESLIDILEEKEIKYKKLEHEGADEESFINVIKDEYGVIHFAGHGYFDAIDPWMSGLIFHGEKDYNIRTVTELVSERFKGAPLFILSACETGRSEFTKGDELVGLIRGLMLAGCNTIIATNWLLSDRVAPYFMKSFYLNYLNGHDVCESLFKARLSIIKMAEEKVAHRMFEYPIYWGVYTIFGNPLKKIKI